MSGYSWFDIGTRIVLPLATFGLGVAFSYALKRLERRQDDERDHVRQVTTLCSEWYDALASVHHALVIHGYKSRNFKETSLRYLRSGTIIPKLRMHQRALCGKDRYAKLLEEVDGLLDALTIDRHHDSLPQMRNPRDALEHMLWEADGSVHTIYNLAAEILGRKA